jgi:hypothetical protein
MTLPGVSETPLRGLYLQPRDFDLFGDLGEFPILSTKVIHDRYFPADRTGVAARRRLHLLALHQLIQTIAVSIARANKPGRMPTFHRLTPYGAEVLLHETGNQAPRPCRSEITKPHTLLHRAGMSEAALSFTDACKAFNLPRPVWHFEYDTVAGVPPTASLSRRFLLRHDFPATAGRSLLCWPDALCQFLLPKGEQTWQLAIAWEFDRSTESHAQIKTKLDGYLPWLAQRSYHRAMPQALDARVFFVVPSEKRRSELIRSLAKHPAATAVRLAVFGDLTPATLLTLPIWRPLDGSDSRPIIDRQV